MVRQFAYLANVPVKAPPRIADLGLSLRLPSELRPVAVTSHQYSNSDNINPPPSKVQYPSSLNLPPPSPLPALPWKNYFKFKENPSSEPPQVRYLHLVNKQIIIKMCK